MSNQEPKKDDAWKDLFEIVKFVACPPLYAAWRLWKFAQQKKPDPAPVKKDGEK